MSTHPPIAVEERASLHFAATPALARLQRARSITDELFSVLTPEAIFERPIPERHRLIFYLGHLEAFDWNQIARNGLDVPSFNPAFDKLFEFGIDPKPGSALADTAEDWPSVPDVLAYRDETRRRIDGLLAQAPPSIVEVAIEHRLMHVETLAYLFHQLPYFAKRIPSGYATSTATSARDVENEWIEIPGGTVTLGQNAGAFGWDNEFPQHRVAVVSFRAQRYKVTNGEYLRFVEHGGTPSHFWVSRNGLWFYRGMFEDIPLPLDWPALVTHDQASAYARWAGKALPSEAQFHLMAYAAPAGEREYPWGQDEPDSRSGNFNFDRWDPAPVDSTPATESATRVAQLVGNGWEWTLTEFAPFEGFRNFDFYPGYSQNFFDGEHYVMKGGSWRTDAALLRRSFRNWFRPDYPYVYASFRLVEND